MIPIDIHTHHTETVKTTAVISISLPDYSIGEKGLFSIGIHPWQTNNQWREQMNLVQHYAPLPQVVAIGECGIDKLWIKQQPKELQQTLSETQMQIMKEHIVCSETYRKPLIIHCVKAFNEIVELKKSFRPNMPWIIHGFRNNANIARLLLNEGFYLSFGEHFQEEALHAVPDNRLFMETDESLLNIEQLIRKVATCRNTTPEQLTHILQQNYQHVFSHSLHFE